MQRHIFLALGAALSLCASIVSTPAGAAVVNANESPTGTEAHQIKGVDALKPTLVPNADHLNLAPSMQAPANPVQGTPAIGTVSRMVPRGAAGKAPGSSKPPVAPRPG